MNPPELLASYWTICGAAEPHTEREHSPLSLRERASSAARAGFTGMGIWHADLAHLRRQHALPEMKRILDDHGIRHIELEFLTDWFVDGDKRMTSDATRHMLLESAEALGARHIKVNPDGDDAPWDPDHWAAQFAELAAQAEGVGARLGLEFFPWSNIKNLDAGLRLVEAAGHDGAGVVIDVWHVERAHTPVADLASVPLHRIVGVELNDADPEVVGTLYEDTVHRRRYCGEGSFDLPGIITALRAAGWTGPWGVEILSEEHWSLPVRDALARAAAGARRLLDAEAGGGRAAP